MEENEFELTTPTQEEKKMLPLMMRMDPEYRASSLPYIEEHLTLHLCNRDYTAFGGCRDGTSDLPEMSGSTRVGSFSPMRRFSNIYGHFEKYRTVCFLPRMFGGSSEMIGQLCRSLSVSIARGYLWDLVGTDVCLRYGNTWKHGRTQLGTKISMALDLVSEATPPPLSLHTCHAHLEAQHRGEDHMSTEIFAKPDETTAMMGLFGTLSNNTAVDMSPNEQPGVHDDAMRAFLPEHRGFICSTFTAHTLEAGRSRRVAACTRVRVLSKATVAVLEGLRQRVGRVRSSTWLLHCMGYVAQCSEEDVLTLAKVLHGRTGPPTEQLLVHVDSESQVATISVSSGVLLREHNGAYADTVTTSMGAEDSVPWHTKLPDVRGSEAIDRFTSSFYHLVPYQASNRPPRTVIAGVQTVQASGLPWSAGTSVAMPNYYSRPLVHTKMSKVLYPSVRIEETDSNPADLIPGMQLCVLLAEWNEVYEDSTVMSRATVQKGLFDRSTHSSFHAERGSPRSEEV
jgi:hypothetical protein